MKREKDLFFADTMGFLGYEVRCGRGATVAAETTKALTEAPPPNSPTEGRRWLGMLNYYRRFIEGASAAFEVVQQAIDKGSFPLNQDQVGAIEELKKRIASPPVLVMPDPDKKKMLITDASGRWVGGALMQLEDDNHWRPCAFRSQRLHDEQTR